MNVYSRTSTDRKAVSRHFDVYGVSVQVSGPSDVVALIDEHTPPCWVPSLAESADLVMAVTEGAAGWRIERDNADHVAGRLTDPLAAAHALLGDAHFQIACRSRQFLYIHAGAVAIDGKALLIPGRSHSGKTSLVAELVRLGATYLSDEYAVIGPDALVHPYARELALRDENGTVTPTPVAQLNGGAAATGPVRTGWVLWTSYAKGSAWTAARVRGSRTVRPLFDNAVLAQDEGPELFDRLSRVMPGVSVWEGSRPDVSIAAAEIGLLLSGAAT